MVQCTVYYGNRANIAFNIDKNASGRMTLTNCGCARDRDGRPARMECNYTKGKTGGFACIAPIHGESAACRYK